MLEEYLYLPYVASGLAAVIALAAIGYLVVDHYRRKSSVFEPPAISEWRATGKIDAMAADDVMKAEDESLPAKFHILVEENRQVADISGAPIGEVRWRLATRAEIKDIIRRHRLSLVDEVPSQSQLYRQKT
jgi:hypothetical protein